MIIIVMIILLCSIMIELCYRIDDDQVSVVGPCAQLHAAVLEVKGEMQHDDFTVALEDGRWIPCDHSCVLQQHFGLMNNGKVTIGAVGGGVVISE